MLIEKFELLSFKRKASVSNFNFFLKPLIFFPTCYRSLLQYQNQCLQSKDSFPQGLIPKISFSSSTWWRTFTHEIGLKLRSGSSRVFWLVSMNVRNKKVLLKTFDVHLSPTSLLSSKRNLCCFSSQGLVSFKRFLNLNLNLW